MYRRIFKIEEMSSKLLRNICSREYSKLVSKQSSQSSKCLVSRDSMTAYLNCLPNITDKFFKENSMPSDIVEHRIKRASVAAFNEGLSDMIIDHTVTEAKELRGTLSLYAYETLLKPESLTEESLQQIRVLAWAVEMTHSCILILNDMADSVKTRHGKPCWHLLPDVGTQALNDASLFRSFIYELLRQNFMTKPSYVDIIHLFDKAFLYTAIGQHLDNTISKKSTCFDNFTMDRYNSIADYKTGYYNIKFPIYLAMTLANKVDKDFFPHLDNICTDIGRLIQIKNNFCDCYGTGTDSTAGTIGRDIQEGKCSWLAVTALERCSSAQRVVFTSCYGSKQPAHIERIKRLYDQLQLPELYEEQERAIYNDVVRKVKMYPNPIFPLEVFIRLLSRYCLNIGPIATKP